MAEELRRCPSCGKPTYKKNPICMWCGAELKEEKKKKKKHTGLKVLTSVLGVILVLGIVGSVLGGGDDNAADDANPSQKTPETTGKPNESKTPSKTESESWEITYQDCWLRESSIGEASFYNAIVEIKNTGTSDLYLKDAIFDFEDKSGHLLETDSFISTDPSIISAGEKAYIYSQGSLEKVGMDTEYVFVPTIKIEKSRKSIIRYEISDTSMENTSDGGIIITGRVQNTTDEEASLVWVCFVLYRADGTPITAGGTNITSLGAGERESFSRTFYSSELGVDASEVADYKVFSEKLQLQF